MSSNDPKDPPGPFRAPPAARPFAAPPPDQRVSAPGSPFGAPTPAQSNSFAPPPANAIVPYQGAPEPGFQNQPSFQHQPGFQNQQAFDPYRAAAAERIAGESVANEASTIQMIQRLDGVRRGLVFAALALLVVTLLIPSGKISPGVILILVLVRTVSWGACGVICIIMALLLGKIGRPMGRAFLNAGIYLLVAILPFLQIFSALISQSR